FGVTIAVATFISVFVSLTLSPAIAALLLKPHKKQVPAFQKASFLAPFEKFLKWFELFMEKLRSEEHTSELQSRENLVCRLLLHTCYARQALHSCPTRRSSDLFGVTIAVATFISVFVSLTLSPAIAALLLKPHKKQVPAFQKASFLAPFEKFLKWFELFMEKL